MAELWDVYDCHRNKTGKFHERGKAMQKDDFNLIVQVWILNSKGEFLISRRIDEGLLDGMWQTTGGCAVTGDDSLSAALRETKEELGITLDQKNGRLFRQDIIKHRKDDGSSFCDVWLFRQEADISSIVLQPDETCGAMWADKEQIRQMIDDEIFIGKWYPYLDELFDFCDKPFGEIG